MQNDNNLRAWVLVGGILVILGMLAWGVMASVQQSTRQAQQAIQPVNEMTSDLATQVAGFMNPTPTVIPDPVTIIHSVRSLARLETIHYSIEKVITAETNQGPFGFLFGDRLIFVAHGIVIAGVDLGRLLPDNLEVREGVLYVRLPEPEVFIATLDNDKSYVYNRDTGLLTRGNIHLETDARKVAEEEIAVAALEDGILAQAGKNAESYLYLLFQELGYPTVIFVEPTPED
jgi:hypothetical protein